VSRDTNTLGSLVAQSNASIKPTTATLASSKVSLLDIGAEELSRQVPVAAYPFWHSAPLNDMAEWAFDEFGSVLTQAQTENEHTRNALRLVTD